MSYSKEDEILIDDAWQDLMRCCNKICKSEDDRQLIRTGVNLKCKLQSVKMYITFNDNGFTVIAVPAMKADENSKVNVMEYITRANYGLRNGNFEMDVNDGEVRYKVYSNAKGLSRVGDDIIEDDVLRGQFISHVHDQLLQLFSVSSIFACQDLFQNGVEYLLGHLGAFDGEGNVVL